MPLFDDVTVVIRAAGERTSVACRQLLAPLFAVDAVVDIREQPMECAVLRALDVGHDEARPWTLVVDADVLVHEGGLCEFLEDARLARRSVFAFVGRVLDKPCAGPRPGGVYLLRTALIPAAKGLVEDARSMGSAEASVSEWHAMRHMAAHGYPWSQHEALLGLHDYDQFLRDLYRKAFRLAHAQPEPTRILESFWRRLSSEDPDYAALCLGLRAGRSAAAGGAAPALQSESIGPALRGAGLKEKGRLAPGSWSESRLAEEIAGSEPPGEYQRWAARERWETGISPVPGGLQWLRGRARIALRRRSKSVRRSSGDR